MRDVLSKVLPRGARERLKDSFGRYAHAQRSYSQEGEDLILLRIFDGSPPGIYVDVGAHHPFRFSNTCLLSERGWRGINIDAKPGSMAPFRKFRPHDINLEIGIGEQASTLEYFQFQEPALNTFDPALAATRRALGLPEAGTRAVQCLPLADVLARELPRLGATTFDLLTVDAEGLDLQVLQSNDWSRFRPRVVIVEILVDDSIAAAASPAAAFLATHGYRLFAKLYNSAIFVQHTWTVYRGEAA